MELKRYVLLNGYNLILNSKNEKELRVVHYDDGDVLKVVVDEWYYPLEKLDYKTSDNILDLVEVGDIIKIVKNDNEVKLVYIEKVNGVEDYLEVDGKFKKQLRINDNTLITDNTLNHVKEVILLKLQPNGDYKKYEVK